MRRISATGARLRARPFALPPTRHGSRLCPAGRDVPTGSSIRSLLAIVFACALATAGCAHAPAPVPSPAAAASSAGWKHLSFTIAEDYVKGEDLRGVEADFRLFRELGIRTWRGSFSWLDDEPARGRFDFGWLHRFCELADRDSIRLRPYLDYTPDWAAMGRMRDSAMWNDPPAKRVDWAGFVRAVADSFRRHRNILSYEIYNEENVPQWWDGSAGEYDRVLKVAAGEIRAADPSKQVILGGMVWPDVRWLEAACDSAGPGSFDVVPFHAYPETWTPDSVTVETYLGPGFRASFVPAVDACGGKPVWVNETGYATTPGRTERQQADWWARAIATFAAEPRITGIGVYEIKDASPTAEVIGGQANYWLGLTRSDRRKKLAFETVRFLAGFLGERRIRPADDELSVRVAGGGGSAVPPRVYRHLVEREDGRRLVVAWTKEPAPAVDLALATPGRSASEVGLDGHARRFAGFDGRTLRDVRLAPGTARMFVIER